MCYYFNMKILSKKHSSEVIKNLNLNRVPELVLGVYDKDAIIKFCNNYPSDRYILRDVDNPSGKYFFCKNVNECVESAKSYSGNFSLGISCFSYKNIILLGEIILTKNNITIVASNDKDANHRNVYQKAVIDTTTTLDDDKLWDVEGVESLIKYLVEHNIYDVIVEFVIYDQPVGVNNHKVLIVELRSNY